MFVFVLRALVSVTDLFCLLFEVNNETNIKHRNQAHFKECVIG